VSARPRTEIMRDLNTLMAELNAATQNERAQTERLDDISPKLEQALGATQRHTRAFMPSTAEVPLESHESIRAKARAYKPVELDSRGDLREQASAVARGYKPADYKYESENPERLKDYTPAVDPDSAWMGTGDHKLVE
jgi:hypothetical protein